MTFECAHYEVGTSKYFSGPVRIYVSKDSCHRLIVPEKLGIELDAITEFKRTLGLDKLNSTLPFYCILPEQLFEEVRKLPNPKLIKEVVLHDHTSDKNDYAISGTCTEQHVNNCTADGTIFLNASIQAADLRSILLAYLSRDDAN